MTDETKNKLLQSVELKLIELTDEVDRLSIQFDKLKNIKNYSAENNFNLDVIPLETLLNYRIFIGIITLDFSVATLFFLKAKFRYEEIYALRQVLVIINEGYKKIYNFEFENKKGDIKSSNRAKSFWVKDIGSLISEKFPQHQIQYESISHKLDEYFKNNFENVKKWRDFSIHYDEKVSEVYKIFSTIDGEEIFQKLILFLQILDEMFIFTSLVIESINEYYLNYNENLALNNERKINAIVELFDLSKTTENELSIEDFKEKILSLKNFT